MKYKIPTNVYVHPDSGAPVMYDLDSDSVVTLNPNDQPIPHHAIEGRPQLKKLTDWIDSL